MTQPTNVAERYTEVALLTVQKGAREAYGVLLNVGAMTFQVGHHYRTREDAERVRERLAIALSRMIHEQSARPEV